MSSALFWAGYEQAGSSLNLFAERFTDRLVGGFEIPAGWFQAPSSLYILLFAPAFSALWIYLGRRNLDPSAPAKFAFGLLLLAYLLHCFGELCLSPVGLSSVTKLAPPRLVGQMMGLWFLATSLGLLIAGRVQRLAGGVRPGSTARRTCGGGQSLARPTRYRSPSLERQTPDRTHATRHLRTGAEFPWAIGDVRAACSRTATSTRLCSLAPVGATHWNSEK